MAELKTFMTPPFRANFTNSLFKPEAMDGGPLKYGVMAIWYPENFTQPHKDLWAKLMGELDDSCMAKFKKKWADLPPNFKKGLRDGSEKSEMGDVMNGATFANLTTKLKPGIVSMEIDPDTGKPTKISEAMGNTDLIFSGVWMRAKVTVYTYDNKGKGVSLGLMNAQYLKTGKRLDYQGDAAADFEGQDEDEDFLNQLDQDDEIPF